MNTMKNRKDKNIFHSRARALRCKSAAIKNSRCVKSKRKIHKNMIMNILRLWLAHADPIANIYIFQVSSYVTHCKLTDIIFSEILTHSLCLFRAWKSYWFSLNAKKKRKKQLKKYLLLYSTEQKNAMRVWVNEGILIFGSTIPFRF